MIRNVRILFASAGAFIFVSLALISATIVVGESMYPTLENGQAVFVRKVNLNPERGDIVTARVDGKLIVKRVVGIPGDVITWEDGTVYVNGGADDFYTQCPGLLGTGIVLGEDEYFLLGDNRQNSRDSRSFGPVNKSVIRGIMIQS